MAEGDVRTCIQEACEEASYATTYPQNANLRTHFPKTPVVVAHDSNLLKRAVSNLVRNALESCRNEVCVDLVPVDQGFHVRVEDDGPGIPSNDVGLFLQGRLKSTKSDRSGYGLVAANHIVRAHGGKIVYRQSALGGAGFEVRI
jgi:K+-sensing histidine kinase KdpD